MIGVLALAGALWGVATLAGAPRAARVAMVGLLLVAVLALQVVLPEGHVLREATGGSAARWLVLLGVLALGAGYWRFVALLKGRARSGTAEAEVAAAAAPGTFGETELRRYARHMVLREIGGPGQKALARARVLVVGAGGLGAPALQYLAAAGIGTIGVIDDDVVEGSNLQRQVIHGDDDIGRAKVFSAADAMTRLNPFITVRPYNRRLTEEIAAELIGEYDLVLDGSDNFATRYLVNAAAAAAKVPLVGGALSQWEGQLSVWDPARGAPCYACVFPEAPAAGLAPSCAEAGVLGPLPGVVGAMMSVEAVKLLAQAGESLRGRLMIYDALYAETRTIAVAPRPGCAVCAPLQGQADGS
ncbi:molybdopterin biosynthesis protein MoeB, putative [Oceanicola granulosus HTCC2516]|uniref:Molybdopterin-synthase adenylyltransferase n=1 Tax=Oceanicola granulosus (strain ATCC BAA-861 / DSM 15982 / KCTC 12143 / HTCC2516) TaxID=314256 RepID=Q2CE05_OCEGH|nr:molybdopterin-synthase adenylyltransferase MoeB [Oceanicola granulosus]EAR50933.1 molybdopterin biosynthesis protein MoeB, putative [Oceanicola granulosus HTCC2516]